MSYLNKFVSSLKVNRINSAFEKIETKSKGTFLENWVHFWKNVFRDYRDVAKDVIAETKAKPLKAVCLVSLAATLKCLSNVCPDEKHFFAALRKYNADMVLVHQSSQKPEARNHLIMLEKYLNEGKVRFLSLGILTVAWITSTSDTCQLYRYQCSYLDWQLEDFRNRILDIGFVNRWWILDDKMIDYDVN